MWTSREKRRPNVFQVLEKAEQLRDADANILPAFLRLQELVRKRLLEGSGARKGIPRFPE